MVKIKSRVKKDLLVKDDFTQEDTWRIFRIMSEFVDGFEVLSKIGQAVSIFGSARSKRDAKSYKLAEEVAYHIAKAGYAIITGSGPGLMEAGTRGFPFCLHLIPEKFVSRGSSFPCQEDQ